MKVVIALILCAVLSACAGLPPSLPFTLTPQTTEIRFLSTPIPSPTHSPTVQPTRTPTSTFRLSDTPIPTATIDAETMMTEQAFEIKVTQVASYPVTCTDFALDSTSISPGGKWLAVSCGYKRDQTLEIVNKDGKRWILQFKDYLPGDYPKDEGNPMGGLNSIHWSSDDVYLYFASDIAWDGGGSCFYTFGVQGLYRINMNTGYVSTTLSPLSDFDGYEIAFSPGGGKLAYNFNSGRPTIFDFRTGEQIAIDAGGGVVGDLTWSPDGSELAYATCQETQHSIIKSNIRIYSLATHTSKTILEVERRLLRIEFWDANSLLKIEDCCFSGNPNYLVFDGSSDEFIMLTPTPTP